MSMAMTPLEQPMPARLWDSTSVRILKWFTTMLARLGVGAKQEQTTIRMSICAQSKTSKPAPKRFSHSTTLVSSMLLLDSVIPLLLIFALAQSTKGINNH